MTKQSLVKLPPQVTGISKGTLTLRVGPLAWFSAKDGVEVTAVARWWGDESQGDYLDPTFATGSAICYILCSGPKYISRYLKDAGQLVLVFKQPTPGAAHTSGGIVRKSISMSILGTASIDVRSLDVGRPITCESLIIGNQGKAIAKVQINMELNFSPAMVSSFELNEHLAAAAGGGAVCGETQENILDLGQQEPPGELPAAVESGHGPSDSVSSQHPPIGATPVIVEDNQFCCSTIFRQLQDAVTGSKYSGVAIEEVSGGQGTLEMIVQHIMSAALGDQHLEALHYVTAAVGLRDLQGGSQDKDDTSLQTVLAEIRECSAVEQSLAEDPGAMARKLTPLLLSLSSRTLDIEKAYGRQESITYPQLVSLLCTLSPSLSALQLRCLLAILAGSEGGGEGRVTLVSLKQAVKALTYAQAFPNEAEVVRQKQVEAERKARAAEAASVALKAQHRHAAAARARGAAGTAVAALRQRGLRERLSGLKKALDGGSQDGVREAAEAGIAGGGGSGGARCHLKGGQQAQQAPVSRIPQQAIAAGVGLEAASTSAAAPASQGVPAATELAGGARHGPGAVSGWPSGPPCGVATAATGLPQTHDAGGVQPATQGVPSSAMAPGPTDPPWGSPSAVPVGVVLGIPVGFQHKPVPAVGTQPFGLAGDFPTVLPPPNPAALPQPPPEQLQRQPLIHHQLTAPQPLAQPPVGHHLTAQPQGPPLADHQLAAPQLPGRPTSPLPPRLPQSGHLNVSHPHTAPAPIVPAPPAWTAMPPPGALLPKDPSWPQPPSESQLPGSVTLSQPPLGFQPSFGSQPPQLSNPLQELISRAQRLQQAMGHAAAFGGGWGLPPGAAPHCTFPAASLGIGAALGSAPQGLTIPNPLIHQQAPATLSLRPAGRLPAPETAALVPAGSAAPFARAAPVMAGSDAQPVQGGLGASRGTSCAAHSLSGASQLLPVGGQAGGGPSLAHSGVSGGAELYIAVPPAVTAASAGNSAGGRGEGGVRELALVPAALPAGADLAEESSWDDPAELAEDIILQELFFSRASPCSHAAGAALLPGTAEQGGERSVQSREAADDPQALQAQQGQHADPEHATQLLLCLRLSSLRILTKQGNTDVDGSIPKAAARPVVPCSQTESQSDTCTLSGFQQQLLPGQGDRYQGVVKPLHPSAPPTHFALAAIPTEGGSGSHPSGQRPSRARWEEEEDLAQHTVVPWSRGQQGGAGAAVEVEVAVPAACVEKGSLPAMMFLEIWNGMKELVGIARVALSFCHLEPPQPAPDSSRQGMGGSGLPCVVCEGRWDVWNVLEGKAAGSLDVFAVVQEKDHPRVVPGVRHGFSVTIQTAYRLPGSLAYAEAELQAPDSRYIKYTFPGEPEPLFTKDVPAMTNPTFDATAQHSLTLPEGQPLPSTLGNTLAQRLRFEVWDQWVDGRQQLHAWAELPMAELAAMSTACTAGHGTQVTKGDSPTTTPDLQEGGQPSAAAFRTHLLPLVSEYDEQQEGIPAAPAGAMSALHGATAKGPALRVDVGYEAEKVLVAVPHPTPSAPSPPSSPEVRRRRVVHLKGGPLAGAGAQHGQHQGAQQAQQGQRGNVRDGQGLVGGVDEGSPGGSPSIRVTSQQQAGQQLQNQRRPLHPRQPLADHYSNTQGLGERDGWSGARSHRKKVPRGGLL